MDVDEEQDAASSLHEAGGAENGDNHEHDGNEEGDDDDDDDDEGQQDGATYRRRGSSTRQKGITPKRIDRIVLSRSARQRSAAQQSQTPPPRSSRGRGKKIEEEEVLEQDDDEDNGEEDEDEVSIQPIARRRRMHASPLKEGAVDVEDEIDVVDVSLESSKPEAETEDVDGGWIEDLADKKEAHEIYATILQRIQDNLAERGDTNLADIISKEPLRKDDRYLTAFTRPVTLHSISQKVQQQSYASSEDFEKDMLQLFRSCRRYFEIGSDEYGGAVAIQRIYNHITQSVDAVREPIDEELLKRNCSSIRFGPCQEPEGQGYGESPRTGEMAAVPRHFYKGKALTVGMWVHLSNPTDPARPIVAQIFKTRVEDLEDRRQDWITACWFLRPEQTRHLKTMTFWEDEVIKTSQSIEHHVEDVLEVVCVNFYTKAARGRPADGEGGWHIGDPLYICENRYQADKDTYFKIKNWASCMPEESRHKRFQMVEYDQPINLPDKLSSPFMRGVDGPGEIVKEMRPSMTGVAALRGLLDGQDEKTTGQPGVEFEVLELFKEWRDEVLKQRRTALRARVEQKASQEKVGQVSAAGDNAQATQSSLPVAVPGPQVSNAKEKGPPIAEAQDRSLLNALSQIDVSAYFQTLPEATQQMFLQDAETGKVVWYPAPPIVSDEQVALQRRWNDGEKFRGHSADYLLYREKMSQENKKKRKSMV
jgi:hypothetical protein